MIPRRCLDPFNSDDDDDNDGPDDEGNKGMSLVPHEVAIINQCRIHSEHTCDDLPHVTKEPVQRCYGRKWRLSNKCDALHRMAV